MSLFQISKVDGALVVACPEELSAKAAAEFVTLSQPWMDNPEKIYVLDFKQVMILERSIFRQLVLVYQSLKNNGSFLFAINVSNAIGEVIKANGLESALSPRTSVHDALESAGIKVVKPPVIDVKFVNPFINATKMTLETQANTPIKIGKPFLKSEDAKTTHDIAGVISLTSPAFQGSIALCFSAKVFLAIYSNMLGEKHDEITKDIEDAAGEILNIIFGQAKAELNNKAGYQIQKAIPTIVRGNQLEIHHLARNVAVVMPFETAAGVFYVEICTEAN